MFKQHHLTGDHNPVFRARGGGGPVDELLKDRVVDDVRGDEVAAARLSDIDRAEILALGGGGDGGSGGERSVGARESIIAVAALGEGGESLDGRFELAEFTKFGHCRE